MLKLNLKRINSRLFAFVLFSATGCFQVFGQQEPQFSHNMFNHISINPAYAGLNNAICATGIVRQQWVGFKDKDGNRLSPETYLVSVDMTVPAIRGGLGATVMQDKIGVFTTNTVKLGYSYHRKFLDSRLGIGLQLGINNTILDAGKFQTVDPTDPLLQGLAQGEPSNMMFDLGFGLFYQVPGLFYVGLSSTRLLESKKEIGAGKSSINFRRHYYATGGYYFTPAGIPSLEIVPSVFIKSDGTSLQYDINSLFILNQNVWGGMSFRVQDAIVFMVGFSLKELRVGYSFDAPVSAVGASGSHEILVNYCFKLEVEKVRKSYRNTRFL